MKFQKKHYRKRTSRTDADIIAASRMLQDMENGVELPLSFYDEISDKACGKESRGIYEEVKKA